MRPLVMRPATMSRPSATVTAGRSERSKTNRSALLDRRMIAVNSASRVAPRDCVGGERGERKIIGRVASHDVAADRTLAADPNIGDIRPGLRQRGELRFDQR